MRTFIKNAEYNSELDGIVLTLSNGKIAQCQWETETNRLSGNCGEEYLHRYTEYDSDDLTDDENEMIDDWVKKNEWRVDRDSDDDELNEGLGWTKELIVESAIEKIEKMSDEQVDEMIGSLSEEFYYMDLEIRINTDGDIYTDSGFHKYHSEECTLSDDPSMLLDYFGFEYDDETGDWKRPLDVITTHDVVYYLCH